MSNDKKAAKSPGPAPFAVSREDERGMTVIAVSGDLDLSTAPQLKEALENASAPRLVVDLGACEFIDSSGIALLVNSFNEASKDGRQMALCGARQQVLRVLEIAGVGDLIPTRDSREEAHATVSG